MHQPPFRQQRPDGFECASGLVDEDPPTSSTNQPCSAAADTLARKPDPAPYTSRATYCGSPSSGNPGTLIAACTPSRRGFASSTRTPAAGCGPPGSGAGSLASAVSLGPVTP